MEAIPFLALDGRRVEHCNLSEAMAYPLLFEMTEYVIGIDLNHVLLDWKGRWIDALLWVEYMKGPPPLEVEPDTFDWIPGATAREITEDEALRRIALAGFTPPPASGSKPPTPAGKALDASGDEAPVPIKPTSVVKEKTPPKPKEPSVKAIQCYRLVVIRGDSRTQENIAKEVYGKNGKQYQVSRAIESVKEWIKAGNVLPDLTEPKPKTYTVDPARLDRGPRKDKGRA
jgi:hypothetical protein